MIKLKMITKIGAVLFFFALFGYGLYGCYDYLESYTGADEYKKSMQEKCENIANYELMDYEIDYCENTYPYEVSFMEMFGTSIVDHWLLVILPITFIFLMLSLVKVSDWLKSSVCVNYFVRKKYSHVIFDLIKKAYAYIWLIPTALFFVILICIYFKGFDTTYLSLHPEQSLWGPFLVQHPILFIFFYLLNVILYLATYINLALIVARKYRKYWMTLIVTCLLILLIQIFLEVVVQEQNLINLLNYLELMDEKGVGISMLISCAWFLISAIGVYFSYRDKEKFVLESE